MYYDVVATLTHLATAIGSQTEKVIYVAITIRAFVRVVFGILLLVVMSGCSAVYHLSGADCAVDSAEHLTDRVKEEKILDSAPPGALLLAGKYVSPACMDDNAIHEVESRYQFSVSPASIVSFYDEVAKADGWILLKDGMRKLNPRHGSSEDWPSATCYSKNIDGHTVDFELSFDYWSEDVEKSPSVKTYWVQISFSEDGGNCHHPDASWPD